MRLAMGSFIAGAFLLPACIFSSPIPEKPYALIERYCLDCHDSDTQKGEVNLETESIDWSAKDNQHLWERVHKVVNEGLMPPENKKQPTSSEREELSRWLDSTLLQHIPIAITPPRRLSNTEYQTTIQKLFEIHDFKLPVGFPPDAKYHGFNNIASGLTISPPLMEAYQNVASQLADSLYPPARETPKVKTLVAGPDDLVLSFSAATVHGDALRLVSRGNDSVMRSCTWPSRMEVNRSGTYRITVSASKFKPIKDEPMELEIRAREVAASDRTHVGSFRFLKTFEFSKESAESFTFDADLYEGQTLMFRWKNAETTHNPSEVSAHMRAWFERDKRMLAAWQHTVYPGQGVKERSGGLGSLRGLNGWNIVKQHLNDPDLDLSNATMDHPKTVALLKVLKTISGGRFNLADAICHYYHENGPALQLHKVSMEGPLKLVDSPQDKQRYAKRKRLFGNVAEEKTEEYFEAALHKFLVRAFRGPVAKETIDRYSRIGTTHWKEGHSFEEGMHLVLRKILVSPRFLFRSIPTKDTQQHQLAARLSYFLKGSPPDSTLLKLADSGQLSDPTVLKKEALRLMPKDARRDIMIKSFTGQWLETDRLGEIMPDPKFKFDASKIGMARLEVEYFFAAMLKENRPLADFIDPDFTYTTPIFAKDVYKIDRKLKGRHDSIQRVNLSQGGRVGGLLGQSAIMLTTANGVDTQPVLRGVWVLENIIGMPPPEAPEDVPALTPDIRGATTPRELLSAHTKEAACAGCHKRIDPVGFVLENYDPVGRWREVWPKSKKKIDPTGVLPDGTKIKDVTELKKWLVENINFFGLCLSEKLMTYATGRIPNYAERKELESIVSLNIDREKGFQDLLLDLIQSNTFRN